MNAWSGTLFIKGNKAKFIFDNGQESPEWTLSPELQWKEDGSPRNPEEIQQKIIESLKAGKVKEQ